MKKMNKRFFALFVSACVGFTILPTVFSSGSELKIQLSDSGITVDGKEIEEDATLPVYQATNIETHEDVAEDLKNLENTVVTIAASGTYRFSGTLTDGQILVDAKENDVVTIILDGVDLSCRTAPAILIENAKETAEVGKAGVTLLLEEGSENKVSGSHTVKVNEDDIKHDAAISSNVSLLVDGTGALTVIGDREGIEVKFNHLTINDGTIHVNSADDPINGSEDGVAHITINGGYVYASASLGQEGDGIDSNGYITINGGTVIALASPNSGDSGLDSDMGTVINGGNVVGAGNMYDEIEQTSGQLYMFLQFAQAADQLICVTDAADNPVFAYDFSDSYSYLSFSTETLTDGIYHVYSGGEITGEEMDGFYSNITSYTGGTPMTHGGTAENSGNGGQRQGRGGNFAEGGTPPEGMEPPEGEPGATPPAIGANPFDGEEMDEGSNRPERPEGATGTPPQGEGTRPAGGGQGGPRGLSDSSTEATLNYTLSADNKSFTNVTSQTQQIAENGNQTLSFTDVSRGDWFYVTVQQAFDQGYMKGISEERFAPNQIMTCAEFISVLYRMNTNDTQETGETWYDSAVNWGKDNGILSESASGAFSPLEPITREQGITMMYNLAKHLGRPTSSKADLSTFADAEAVSDFAQEAVQWAVGSSLLSGDGSNLNPNASLTRAEAATVLVRYQEMISAK